LGLPATEELLTAREELRAADELRAEETPTVADELRAEELRAEELPTPPAAEEELRVEAEMPRLEELPEVPETPPSPAELLDGQGPKSQRAPV